MPFLVRSNGNCVNTHLDTGAPSSSYALTGLPDYVENGIRKSEWSRSRLDIGLGAGFSKAQIYMTVSASNMIVKNYQQLLRISFIIPKYIQFVGSICFHGDNHLSCLCWLLIGTYV